VRAISFLTLKKRGAIAFLLFSLKFSMPGYITDPIRQLVRETFGNRCAYCLGSQLHVYGILEMEHVVPSSRGGTDEENNLCLACRFCNLYKSDQTEAVDPLTRLPVPLFHPREQQWHEHFSWERDGATIAGLTATGRATVAALQMNNPTALAVRREWVRVGWYPPQESF
jgi:hypothetical protein